MTTHSERSKRASQVTWLGIIWNIFLTIFKFIAGIVGHSSALIADAIHSLSDFASDFAVLAGLRLADKPRDETHNYGHGKFETLSTIVIAILLFTVAIGLLWNGSLAIFQAFNSVFPAQPGYLALLGALVSIVIKEFLFRYTLKAGRALHSQALIANAWHHRSDALSSIAVFIGISGAIFLGKNWTILDPIAAILVSILIVKFAYKTFIDAINELLEASLSEERKNEIIRIAEEVPGVSQPHNMKTRQIGNKIAIDMHIRVKHTLTIVQAHEISTRVEDKLKDSFGQDSFISIHVEPDLKDLSSEQT